MKKLSNKNKINLFKKIKKHNLVLKKYNNKNKTNRTKELNKHNLMLKKKNNKNKRNLVKKLNKYNLTEKKIFLITHQKNYKNHKLNIKQKKNLLWKNLKIEMLILMNIRM